MWILTAKPLLSSARVCAMLTLLMMSVVSNPGNAAIDPELLGGGDGRAVIQLLDGSRILGSITGLRDGRLMVSTAFSPDDLAIDLAQVDSFEWKTPVQLLMNDDSLLSLNGIDVEGGIIQLAQGGRAVTDVAILNPARWEHGDGYRWAGDTSAAIAYTRGNTQTDEFDVAANSVFESTRDRITLNARFENDFAYNLVTNDAGDSRRDKVTTAENWRVLGKYDFFLSSPRNYLGINASVEADALAGVELRTYAGPYFGRRLIDSANLLLDGELGIAYVQTEFDPALNQPDNDYTGVNWNFNAESGVLGGDAKLYFRHVGILNADETDQVILKNTAGLSFPLVFGLEGSAEFSLDYDGTAAAGREEIDEAYRFRVGYAW